MNAQLPILIDDPAGDLVERRLALDHLLLRLRPLNRALRQLAHEQSDRTARLLGGDEEAQGISAQHALQLFEEVDAVTAGLSPRAVTMAPSEPERAQEAELRQAADRAGLVLPLDAMKQALGLSRFETATVVACAAPHLSLAYRRLFAFVHDDTNRLAPSGDLLRRLQGGDPALQLGLRDALSWHGPLQRFGLLHSPIEAASELLREFQLGPGVFDALLRFDCDWVAQFPDRDAVNCAQSLPLELFPDHARLLDVAALLRSGRPACVGLWGGPARGGRAAAAATAQAAGRPLRALAPIGENPAERFVRAIEVARALNAVLLIEVDAFGSGDAAWRAALAALSASAGADVILTGTTPSHPLELLQGRAAIDVHLAEPGLATRKA